MRFERALTGIAICCVAAALAAEEGAPRRWVEGTTLVSDALPAIRVELDDGFRYVGVHPFRVADTAAGDRYVFADADETGRVRRLFVFQFEGFLPESGETYRYSFEDAREIGGHLFRHNVWAYSNEASGARNPQGEAALTRALLESEGLSVPDELMASRFLTVPDAAKRHELILFYLEPLRDAGARLDELYADDRPTPLWERIGAELEARSLDAFRIVPD